MIWVATRRRIRESFSGTPRSAFDLLQLRAGGALADLNEYVQSPPSKLEEPVIRRLYEALSGQYEPEKPKPPPEWQRQGRSHEGAVNGEVAWGPRCT